jgi:hypothetical protein
VPVAQRLRVTADIARTYPNYAKLAPARRRMLSAGRGCDFDLGPRVEPEKDGGRLEKRSTILLDMLDVGLPRSIGEFLTRRAGAY